MNAPAAGTVSTVPWYYVALLAGGFTVLGALVSFVGIVYTSRRKTR